MKFVKKHSNENIETKLDVEIEHSVDALKDLDPYSEEYARVVKNVKAIHDVKDESKKVNINTVLTVGGSIASVLAIIAFEKFGGGIFTSKAAGFIVKPRV